MSEVLIVEDVGKRFKAYHSHRPTTFMQAVLSGLRKMQSVDEFWALKEVSFSVEPGEILGVLGHNGAGKSTLLQLIGGVSRADTGRIWVNGRIGALLDMGAGFHSDLTGRENVMISGLIAGLTKQQILDRFNEIVEFAELNDFIENPIRTYSSGMRMRLAFSIAIHNDPDLLLVDEHLSVGDIRFQAKCIERIEQLQAGGCSIILISQSPTQIQELCDRALLLNQGKVVAYGVPAMVREQYEIQMGTFQPDDAKEQVSKGDFSHSPLRIQQVQLSPRKWINSGQPLSVEIAYTCSTNIYSPMFNLCIVNYEGETIFSTQATLLGTRSSICTGSGRISLHFDRLDLPNGDYFINCGLFSYDWTVTHDYHGRQHPLRVRSHSSQTKGYINPPHQLERHEQSSIEIQTTTAE